MRRRRLCSPRAAPRTRYDKITAAENAAAADAVTASVVASTNEAVCLHVDGDGHSFGSHEYPRPQSDVDPHSDRRICDPSAAATAAASAYVTP